MNDNRYELTDSDQRFFDSMRAAVASQDPVPSHVVDAAKAAFGWRSIDAELAQLIYDSSTEQLATAGVRGDSSGHHLRFESAALSVVLQILTEGAQRVVIGEIVPQKPAEVQIFHPGGISTVRTDERGRFRARDVKTGLMSLRCRLFDMDGDRMFRTDWVTL